MAKSPQPQNDSRNVLLSKLPREQFESLQPSLQLVDLEPAGCRLRSQPVSSPRLLPRERHDLGRLRHGRRPQHRSRHDRPRGHCRRHAPHGRRPVPYRYFTQLSGEAQRIDASRLIEAADRSPELRIADSALRSSLHDAIDAMRRLQRPAHRAAALLPLAPHGPRPLRHRSNLAHARIPRHDARRPPRQRQRGSAARSKTAASSARTAADHDPRSRRNSKPAPANATASSPTTSGRLLGT